jgi:chromosome partitioning protein
MSRVFAFMNLKGGVGKTVLGANLAREFSTLVKSKILLVDLDPQCSLSNMLMYEEAFTDRPRQNTTHEALYSELNNHKSLLEQDVAVVYVDSGALFSPPSGAEIHLLPGSTEIYNLIVKGGTVEYQHALESFQLFIKEAKRRYEYIFLDTNPSTNIATLCALESADFVIAPITMDIFAVRGIFMLRNIFGNDFPTLASKNRTIGIWNAVDSKYRHSNKESPAEIDLYRKNSELIEFALTNRIYHSGYLDYRGKKRGFLQDTSSITRADFFNRAKKDMTLACHEMMQRFEIRT